MTQPHEMQKISRPAVYLTYHFELYDDTINKRSYNYNMNGGKENDDQPGSLYFNA